MPFPSDVITRPVSVGGAMVLESSGMLSLRVVVRASKSLVRDATGYRFEKLGVTSQGGPGAEVVINLPVTDQAGWKDPALNALIDVSVANSYTHQYTAEVHFTDSDGNAVGIPAIELGPFVVPSGDTVIDLDKNVPASTIAGGAVSIPDIWSQKIAEAEAVAAELQSIIPTTSAAVAAAVTTDGPAKQALNTTIGEVSASEIATAGKPARVATDARVLAVGDPRYARPIGAFWTAIGDSLTAGSLSVTVGGSSFASNASPGFPTGENFMGYALALAGGAITPCRNAGVGGERTDQIAARLDAELAYGPNVMTLMAGINDILQGITLPVIRANIAAMVAKIRAAGVRPVLLTLPPTNNTANRTAYAQLNAWLRGWAAKNGVTLVDITPSLSDQSTGGWLSGLNADNVHPTAAGMLIIAQLVSDTLMRIFPNRGRPVPAYNTDPTNLCLNGLLLNDAGNDGIPDNFNVLTDGSYSVPGPLTTDATFARGKIATLTHVSGTFSQWNQGFGSGQITAGDIVEAGVALELVDTGTADFYVFFGGASNGERKVTLLSTPSKGYAYNRFVVPNGATSILFRIRKSGAGTLRFGEPMFRNLTALGLA